MPRLLTAPVSLRRTQAREAAQRQIERDNLAELIADLDKTNGPADPQAVASKRAKLTSSASSDAGAAA
ncbi:MULTISPECIES: hypothetical protein [unclassified Streptomyces]|uniref:hypothetical protein n=1 Tax=unclassified Streptomyces TaxID=2593676 RepID=UPI000CD4BFD3|nr:hypothetical protein [Streptomyces sp. SM10]